MGQRSALLLGFLICVVLMVTALYFQYGLELEPCPLCILQRVSVISIGLVMLAAAIHNPGVIGRRIYGLLVVAAAGFGFATAARNSWLQHLPADQVPSCGPGLDYMLNAFPFHKALAMVFQGSGECAEVKWSFLGFSIPEWLLPFFTGFIIAGLIMIFSRRILARR